ncbi:MAG: glucosamine-6-phosphate deaminase [Ferruginibacter sp.]
MQLNIYKDYEALSNDAAEIILAAVKANPTAVLCLATGDTPRFTYKLLAEKAIEEKVDFSGCSLIGLDEWVGISSGSEGDCRLFLERLVIAPLNIPASQVHLFNGLATDMDAECSNMDQAIAAKGGIDLMLVGVGLNGHIGFNEPGILTDLYAHVINLQEITQSIGQKYFNEAVAIKQGITLGFKHVLQSKKLIMMANGEKKAAIMQKAVEEEISSLVPASIIRTHAQSWAMLDEAAAALINLQILPDDVVVGHNFSNS